MLNLTVFESTECGKLRAAIIGNEVWFVGKDVADTLGYKDTSDALKRHVDEEDKLSRCFTDSGQSRDMYIINESGLYSLILSSKLPNAKKFKRWVTSEVLPSIRKTGGYQMPTTNEGRIKLLASGVEEVYQRVGKLEERFTEYEDNQTLTPIDQDEIVKARNKKAVSVLGGHSSSAYRDKTIRGKVYADLTNTTNTAFGVHSYKAIKHKDVTKAVEIIREYVTQPFLQKMIDGANAQEELQFA